MKEKQITLPKTFVELFDIILTGNKDDSRKAAREVRKLLYGSHSGGEYDEIKAIIENAPDRYSEIKEVWREENFVVAVSVLYFLHDKESQPDFLFSWLFHLLQHHSGNVRMSAVRMIETELGPLTLYIRCPEYKADDPDGIKSEQADFILLNLFIGLNGLLGDLCEPKYKKYKYVDSLPACPYKSVQIVLSRLEDDCGRKYMTQLESRCV